MILPGLVAVGDSITYGHGGMQSGLGSQSWAQWLAEAMGLAYTRLAVNGATSDDVVKWQLPKLADHEFAVGCAYIGVNDVRAVDWDAAAYERDLDVIYGKLRARCERVVAMTLPLALGLPPAGAKVGEANEIVERLAAQHGVVVADLRDFAKPAWVWADRVHATATGQVELADRAARALGAPLPSRTVVDVPKPDAWYWWHFGKRAVRERLRRP